LRRGKPTNHKVYGEAVAVLAGDGLLNEAMTIMFDYCTGQNKNDVEACLLLSKCSGPEGMICGQVVDIINEGKNVSFDELEYIHRKKTGALIKGAILAGAILGNAPENELEILGLYGEKLGLAFQIKDDVLDVTGDIETLGKPIHSDENNNKTTFVTIHGLDKCKELCEVLTEECMELLDKLPRDTGKLKEITDILLQRQF
jgi:geranylgeranyl diphosphate synthase type II